MLLKHTGLYLFAEIIPILLAFISISVYTRYLSTDEYAMYYLVMTAVWMVSAFLIYWLRMSVVRFWNMRSISKGQLIGTISSLSSLIILFVFFVFLLASYFLVNNLNIPFSLIITGLVLFAVQALFELNMKIKTLLFKAGEYTLINILRAVITVSIGVVLVINGFGAIGVLLSLIIAFTALLIFTSRETWEYIRFFSFDKKLTGALFKYGVPVSLATMLQTIGNSTDRYLLVWLDSLSSAGIYSVASSMLGTSLSMLLASLSVAFYPIVLNALENNDKQEVINSLNQYACIFIGFSIPAVIGLVMVAPNLLSLLIGEDFLSGTLQVFPWLALSELFYGLQAFYFAVSFQISKNTIGLVWIMLASTVINIILNIVLIPEYSIVGAAIATVISSFVGLLLTYFFGNRLYILPLPWKDILKILFASGVMLLSIYGIYDEKGWGWLLIQIGIGMVIYFICIMLLNVANIRKDFNKIILSKIMETIKT